MTTRKYVEVTCDGGDVPPGGEWPRDYTKCPASFSDRETTQEDRRVRREAKAAGWVSKDGWDYCPTHKAMAP